MRRAAVSIVSNIAEGYGRGTERQILHFLDIAQGSAYELETQYLVSKNLNYIQEELSDAMSIKIISIQKMLHSLQKSIRK